MSQLRYIMNIDIEESLVHIDGRFHEVDRRCMPQQKDPEDGEWREVTLEEAEEFLSRRRPLVYRGRHFTNLRRCRLCFR